MPLVLVGINHESAPVEVREKLAIGEHALPRSLAALAALPPVVEGAILSTCNRTEIYAVLDSESGATEEILAEFLAGQHGLARRLFDGRIYVPQG